MKIKTFLLWCLLIVYARAEKFQIKPVVSTIYGDVQGVVMQSRGGRVLSAFRGIPYARPPTQELRFKAPKEPEEWADTLDASKDGSKCIQQDYLYQQNPEVEGSEDCLYINVYTPIVRIYVQNSKLVKPMTENLLPVMVYIHGGGYMSGSSSSEILGPAYLMDRDVLLVTFNYRLGIFGFFSTYDDAAPGNWALKDQVAALNWVQKNIEEFGGDPKRVTIFGQSAGGGSVHFHILSPRSEGLFQAAITQSGSALALWAQPQRELVRVVANTQADLVGCNSTVSSTEMVACLRGIPADKLVESMNQFRFMRAEPYTVYVPAIEKESEENPEPFITKDPIDIIQNGEFSKVPWIIGVMSNEGIIKAAPLTRQDDLLATVNDNFEEYLPKMLSLELSVDEDEIPDTWDRIRGYYFLNQSGIDVNDTKVVQGLIHLYSDRGFLYPSYQMALLHRHNGHENIWFYYFDYKGYHSYGDLFAATENDIDFEWGTSHCDDLIYLFHSPALFSKSLSSNDLAMSHFLINIFTNLATYLDPTPGAELYEGEIRWRPLPNTDDKQIIENSDLHYLVIAGEYSPSHNAFEIDIAKQFIPGRIAFWQKLPLKENIKNLA